jgi:cyclic pyranopterin phosphate synthase
MIDGFGRHITYVRMSVTDRCDLRCRYCMGERMTFLPRKDVLTLEEIADLADIFIARGVDRIRLTGGEPLVRKGIDQLVHSLGQRLGSGLKELTMTTNGTQLSRFAPILFEAGIRRINVSLDSRNPDRFRHITRRGDLAQVLAGIGAATDVGLRVKINMVALR